MPHFELQICVCSCLHALFSDFFFSYKNKKVLWWQNKHCSDEAPTRCFFSATSIFSCKRAYLKLLLHRLPLELQVFGIFFSCKSKRQFCHCEVGFVALNCHLCKCKNSVAAADLLLQICETANLSFAMTKFCSCSFQVWQRLPCPVPFPLDTTTCHCAECMIKHSQMTHMYCSVIEDNSVLSVHFYYMLTVFLPDISFSFLWWDTTYFLEIKVPYKNPE